MLGNVISIGILFNAFVGATVTVSALALMILLIIKRRTLNTTMQAYAWFWWFTAIVWLPSVLRYLAIGFGVYGSWITELDQVVQAAVFLSGPPLFYYLIRRLSGSDRYALWASLVSFLLALVAIFFVLQPNGVVIVDVSAFSADARVNDISFAIFAGEIFVGIILLFIDLWQHFKRYRLARDNKIFLEGSYSIALLVYVLLGTIDESKIITDWPLVVFRMLYAASLLVVFVLLLQQAGREETFLYEQTPKNS